MKLTALQYAKTLFETLQDTADKDHEVVLDNFVKVLAQNNDLPLYEQIIQEYERIDKAAQGIQIAHVTTAKPLEKHSEKAILDQLNKIVKGKVEIRKQVDENIIGGVVIKMDDTLIDASVKKSLQELKNELSK